MPTLRTPMLAAYSQSDGEIVGCDLCPHHCRLREGQFGRCRVRVAHDGQLFAASYGRVSSAQVDPIEKKPLYHYYPGSRIFSVGGWGCNFCCDFCQNWSISQAFADDAETVAPDDILVATRRAGIPRMAYTYNEPLVNFEFVRDCARLMRAHDIGNVLVTNGYAETGPATELLALMDAVNLDIKSMDAGFYRRRCGGQLQPVLRFARLAQAAGVHLEITHLLVPDDATGLQGVASLADWIAAQLGPEVPLHISAYYPQYRSNTPATAPDELTAAYTVAAARLRFVYLGNVRSAVGRDTLCPHCGHVWIRRADAAAVIVSGIRNGKCSACGTAAAIRMQPSNDPDPVCGATS